MITRSDVTVVSTYINPNAAGRHWLVEVKSNYYIVSSADVPYDGPEVMSFSATPEGRITSFLEVAVVRGTLRHEDGIAALIDALNEQ